MFTGTNFTLKVKRSLSPKSTDTYSIIMFMSAYIEYNDSENMGQKRKTFKKSSTKKSKWDMSLNHSLESDYECFTNSIDDCETWNVKNIEKIPFNVHQPIDNIFINDIMSKLQLQDQLSFLELDKENNFSSKCDTSESLATRKKTGNSLSKKVYKAKRTLKNCFKPSVPYQRNIE